ncbi:MAG TPA: dihydrofolate reductase family protein [Ignavibacteria bacterium]|nr:dihydrofolate reductase family protein [Ignavibacteria bacterium]HMQ98810.1 dihydrofolate reductase family protein [Ignavibacteria bacterium]
MRKLKLQVQISIDGFVCGPNGELDWMTWNLSDDLKKFIHDLSEPIDTILMGKNMTDGFVNHWKNVKADKDNPEHWAGVKFTDTPKVVFSRTLKESAWENTTLASGNLTDEVNKLKAIDGNYLMVYGGAGFVNSLIKDDLIDDYYLFINPAVIGNGKRIFDGVKGTRKLKLLDSYKFGCGVVVNHYEK